MPLLVLRRLTDASTEVTMASHATRRQLARALLLTLFVVALAPLHAGCYVASVFGLTDTTTNEFDETLLGRWRSAEGSTDGTVELLVDRDEWRSYAVTWKERSGETRYTARLARVGTGIFFDATVLTGTEVPAAMMPVHILGRVTHDDRTLSLALLNYDWFAPRVKRGALSPLTAVVDDRDMLLITSPRAMLRSWLGARVNLAGMFEDPLTFERSPEEPK
jgi:hypothetical protein